MSSESWLNLLDAKAQERVLALMRELDVRAEMHLTQSRILSSGGGAPAGGADFDEFVKGNAIRDFLSALRNGENPEGCVTFAKRGACEAVEKHNRVWRNDHVVQRWIGCCDSLIEDMWRALITAALQQPGDIISETLTRDGVEP